MSSIVVKSELDAAEALLELQRDYRESKYDQSCGKENALHMASFLYNLMGSRESRSSLSAVPTHTSTPKTSPRKGTIKPEPNVCTTKSNKQIDRNKTSEVYSPQRKNFNGIVKCKVPKQEAVITKVWADSLNDNCIKITNPVKITHDKGTQTEIEYQTPDIEKMEHVIRGLCSKIKALETRLKYNNSESLSRVDSITDQNTYISNDERSIKTERKFQRRQSHKRKRTSTVNSDNGDYNSNSANTTHKELSENESDSDKEYSISSKILKTNHSNKIKSEMVSIGDGKAIVPYKLMKNMDWSSYTNATRKLLTAVFSRKVLATHSLTGKPSPAFPDKPAKKKLNTSLVNDIVQTVVERCNVPESVVRTSITTKCADESKMFRSRQQNKNKRTPNKRNRENIPPLKYESYDSDISNESYLTS